MPPVTTCPSAQTYELLLQGRVPAEQMESLLAHLQECAVCAESVQSLPSGALGEALRGTAVPEETDPLRPLIERVVEMHKAGATTLDAGAPKTEDTFDEMPTLAPPLQPGDIGRLDHYRVLRRLGQGGMGVVYLAEDERLKRRVALKVMRPGVAARPEAKQRFLREAQTAAAIEHDNIVAIYHVGEDRGMPFLAMPLLQGETLEARLKHEPNLPLSEVVRLGREIAEGLTAAHERGLIHRDIKPANIWLETVGSGQWAVGSGRVKLLDFGLARSSDGGDQVTRSGTVLGTPAYMAPEQARGKAVDVRADLFSLGVVLYRMATGVLPFDGPDTLAILSSLALDTPPAPREVNPQVPVELSNLIMKLLAKDPAQRPSSAREVAARLNFSAKPQAAGGGGKKPRAALVALGLLGLAAAAVVAGVIIIVRDKDGKIVGKFDVPEGKHVEVSRTEEPKYKPKYTEPGKAEPEKKENPPIAVIPPEKPPVNESPEKPPVDKPPAPKPVDVAKVKPAAPVDPLALDDPTRPLANLPPGQPLSSQAFVQKPAGLPGALGWTVETRGHRGAIAAMAYRPGTKLLATAGQDSVIRFWEDGKLVRALFGHTGNITALQWSRDGKTLATAGADKLVRLWDAETGELRHAMEGHTLAVNLLAWSPDGKRLASAGDDLVIRLWDPATGKLIHPMRGEKDSFSGLGWLADNKTLVTGDGPKTRYWDADAGLPKNEQLLVKEGWLQRVVPSPDGKTLAVAETSGLQLLTLNGQTVTGQPLVIEKSSTIGPLAWSRDGQRFAWVHYNSVSVGHVKTSQVVRELSAKTEALGAVAFSPDGAQISAGAYDGTIYTWDANTEALLRTAPGAGIALVTEVTWSGDDRRFATGEGDGTVRVWNAATGEPEHTVVEAFQPGWLALSADGKLLAIGTASSPQIHVWDVEAGKRLQAFDGEGIVSWSPHGKKLAYCGKGGGLFLWDAGSDKPPAAAAGEPVRFTTVSWSRDGGRIAAFGFDKIWVWDTATGKSVKTISAGCYAGALSPDGKRLAMGRYGLRIWDLDTGRSEPEQIAAHSEFRRMVWRPDGKSVVALNDGEVITWDLERTGEPSRLTAEGGWVRTLSTEGRWALLPNRFALSVRDLTRGSSGAMLLAQTSGRSAAIASDGHWRTATGEADLVYIVKPSSGPNQVLTPAEFAKKYGWKNDAAKVKLTP